MPKTLEKFIDIYSRLETIEARLSEMNQKVALLIPTGKATERTFTMAAPVNGLSSKTIKELGESDPIPLAYREIVDTVLNKNFETHITSAYEGFMFSIVVPSKYSSLKPELSNGLDVRSRVIGYELKSEGVKEWATTVFKNFTPDMQAMIVSDRVNNYELST